MHKCLKLLFSYISHTTNIFPGSRGVVLPFFQQSGGWGGGGGVKYVKLLVCYCSYLLLPIGVTKF